MLLPAAPQDWLPPGHLAHFIDDTVDALDLKAFYARYEGGGSRNQPFHLKELSELFVQVVKLAREMGLVKLGTVAIDGTKLKANASRHKAMSDERMKQAEAELKAQIDALLARAKATDESEVNEPELDLPAEIERREARLAAIREARERL